jgi:hypothetical protein
LGPTFPGIETTFGPADFAECPAQWPQKSTIWVGKKHYGTRVTGYQPESGFFTTDATGGRQSIFLHLSSSGSRPLQSWEKPAQGYRQTYP